MPDNKNPFIINTQPEDKNPFLIGEPLKKKGPTLPEYGSQFVQYGTVSPAPVKYVPPKNKPQNLSEAAADDNNYIAALWNQIPDALSDAIGGLSKFAGKAFASQPIVKAIESGFDVANLFAPKTQQQVNPLRSALTTERLEAPGRAAEELVQKARLPYSSKKYEQSLMSGFDITNGIGLEDVKAAPLFITRLAADAGLSVPTFGTSFVAQGYNQGLKEYDDAIKSNPELRNDDVRSVFGVLYGSVNGALDKLGVDGILKTPEVSKYVKKVILRDALSSVVKSGAKITSESIEKAAQEAAKRGYNKIKDVGVKALIGGASEGFTEPIQGSLSDGIKLLTNDITYLVKDEDLDKAFNDYQKSKGTKDESYYAKKYKDLYDLSQKDVFDSKEIKENFWKNRINEAAAGSVGGLTLSTALRGVKSSDKYIADRVAESSSKENIDAVKSEIQSSVENGDMTEDDAVRLTTALDSYVASSSRLPQGLGTEQRAKAIKAMSDRDSILGRISEIKSSLGDIDEAIAPEIEQELSQYENKIEFLNDQIREAVTGKKYKYFQDDTGRTFKQLVKPGATIAKAVVSKGSRAETAQQIPTEYYEFVTQDESIPDEYKPKSVKQKKIDIFADRIANGEDMTSPEDVKFYEDNKQDIDQKLKDNAVQEQTAGEVPVQPETQVSGEVVEGEPQAKPQEVTEVKEKVEMYDDDIDIAIENIENIKKQKSKLERGTVSKKTQDMAGRSIKDSETQLSSANQEAVKRVKDVDDSFDDIKQQLKDKGLLTSLQKGCL